MSSHPAIRGESFLVQSYNKLSKAIGLGHQAYSTVTDAKNAKNNYLEKEFQKHNVDRSNPYAVRAFAKSHPEIMEKAATIGTTTLITTIAIDEGAKLTADAINKRDKNGVLLEKAVEKLIDSVAKTGQKQINEILTEDN